MRAMMTLSGRGQRCVAPLHQTTTAHSRHLLWQTHSVRACACVHSAIKRREKRVIQAALFYSREVIDDPRHPLPEFQTTEAQCNTSFRRRHGDITSLGKEASNSMRRRPQPRLSLTLTQKAFHPSRLRKPSRKPHSLRDAAIRGAKESGSPASER